jgi:hypothetical protein
MPEPDFLSARRTGAAGLPLGRDLNNPRSIGRTYAKVTGSAFRQCQETEP